MVATRHHARLSRWAATPPRSACAGCPPARCPASRDGMVIGQHGSWNRSKLCGYKVIFVPFANGSPSGPPRDILTGFLSPDEQESYGRPVGVAIGPDGACWWPTTSAT